MEQVVACALLMQRARVRSPVGISFLGEVFSGFFLTCKTNVWKLLGPQGPRRSYGHHYHPYSFITGANDLKCWRALKLQIYKYKATVVQAVRWPQETVLAYQWLDHSSVPIKVPGLSLDAARESFWWTISVFLEFCSGLSRFIKFIKILPLRPVTSHLSSPFTYMVDGQCSLSIRF